MFKVYIFLLYLWVGSTSLALTQRKFKQENQVDGTSVSASMGVASVAGELGNIVSFKPIYSINIDKGISEKVNISVGLIGGNLNGSENKPYFSEFKTDYFQVYTEGIFNVSRYFITSYNKNVFEMKLYGGVGMIWFHTKVYDLSTGNQLRATSEVDSKHTTLFQPVGSGIGDSGIYYTRELVIPFGFKIQYNLNRDWALNLDLGYNWVNNDKLDGTTPYNILNPSVVAGINSYSDTSNDGWINLSVGLKYIFSFKRNFIPRGV